MASPAYPARLSGIAAPAQGDAVPAPTYARARLVTAGITAHGRVVGELNAVREQLQDTQLELGVQRAAGHVLAFAVATAAASPERDAGAAILSVIDGVIEALMGYAAQIETPEQLAALPAETFQGSGNHASS